MLVSPVRTFTKCFATSPLTWLCCLIDADALAATCERGDIYRRQLCRVFGSSGNLLFNNIVKLHEVDMFFLHWCFVCFSINFTHLLKSDKRFKYFIVISRTDCIFISNLCFQRTGNQISVWILVPMSWWALDWIFVCMCSSRLLVRLLV